MEVSCGAEVHLRPYRVMGIAFYIFGVAAPLAYRMPGVYLLLRQSRKSLSGPWHLQSADSPFELPHFIQGPASARFSELYLFAVRSLLIVCIATSYANGPQPPKWLMIWQIEYLPTQCTST